MYFLTMHRNIYRGELTNVSAMKAETVPEREGRRWMVANTEAAEGRESWGSNDGQRRALEGRPAEEMAAIHVSMSAAAIAIGR